jgi:hypothetical protein
MFLRLTVLLSYICYIKPEVFMAAKHNEVFSGYQPHQYRIKFNVNVSFHIDVVDHQRIFHCVGCTVSNRRMIVNNELERMRKEVVKAYSEISFQHLPRWTKENDENLQGGWRIKLQTFQI